MSAKHFRFSEFELDVSKRLLLRDGEPVSLSPKTLDLLLVLVESRGEIVTKDTLLEKVWPDQIIEEGNLKVHVSALRKAFGQAGNDNRFIVTVPGRGYSFVAEFDEAMNGDVIVESHTLSRIVVEETTEDTADPIRRQSSGFLSANRKSRNYLFGVAAIGVVLAVAFGYWLYLQNSSPNLAAGWIEPKGSLKPFQLTTNGKVAFAALSPDGEHFAYTVGQTDKPSLWYAHTNGKQQIQIRPPEDVIFYGLTFAPDGAEIFYSAEDEKNPNGALFRIPALGGSPQRVLTNIESPVTFSPDGKQLAFVRNAPKRKESTLVVTDGVTNGSNERVVATQPLRKRFSLRGASWSPDGKFIAVGVVGGGQLIDEEVVLVNVNDGTVEKLGTQTFQAVRRVAWLPDGSGLFVNAIEKDVWDDRHLWLIEYPSGKTHKVTQDLFHYGMFNLSISNDGAKVLSVGSTKICNVFVSPAHDLKRARKITANSLGKLTGTEGMAWTPDGKIVYSAFFDKGHALWIMDADGSNARQLTSSGFLDRFPTVTNDASFVVFNSNRGDGLWRLGLGDQGELKQLTTRENMRPSVTPDGRWVLFGARTNEGFISVWKVAIDGGEPIRLTDKSSGFVRVSPDGKMFACSYSKVDGEQAQLAVFSIDGGEPLHVFDLPPRANLSIGIRWAPDGRSLAYRDFGPSLWKQDLTGGEPEKILEFPDEIIYSFDWSFDGAQFAIAHGEDVRDVVLVTNDR